MRRKGTTSFAQKFRLARPAVDKIGIDDPLESNEVGLNLESLLKHDT
jgi:hypothetical protein